MVQTPAFTLENEVKTVPSVATLMDLQTTISALQTVFAPQINAYAELKADLNTKHEENKVARHKDRNDVETALSAITLDILNARERVASVELKLNQAVGPDGTSGTIRELKDGQEVQLKATRNTRIAVKRLEEKISTFMPTLEAMKLERESRELIEKKRDNAKDWAEMMLKYGAVIAGAIALFHHFH